MIGFINLVCIVLLFVSFCENGTNKNPRHREKLQETIDAAKSANLKAIFLALIPIVLEALVLVDEKLWHKLWLENSYGSISDWKDYVPSPIFHVDYLDGVWAISMAFVWILIVVSAIFFLGMLISRATISDSVNEELAKCEKREADRIAKEKAMVEKNDAEAATISAMMSHYDKVIPVDANEYTGYKGWANAFYVNVSDKKIIAAGRLIDFSDLISCTFVDNGHVKSTQKGTANSQTKADNGSVVGRAVVGGIIGGGAGAVIGGATAKNNTTTQINTTTTTRTIHDYTVVINVKDILSPVCKIHCGENEKAVNEIVGTVNAILQSL